MTSQDSGIETGNDSNDSSYPQQDSNESSPIKVVNFRYQSPATLSTQIHSKLNKLGINNGVNKASTSNQPETSSAITHHACAAHSCVSEDKTVGLPMFRLPNPRSSALDVDPPAGLSFNNLQPSTFVLGSGYEIIGQDFVFKNIELQLKLKAVRCRLRSARDAWTQFKTPLDERKLRRAVSMNNVELVESLLASGVNPNSCDAHRRTPLHLAACRGYTDVLRLLIARGADPNRKDALGNTPLHIAACTNNVEVVTQLIRAGTDVSSGDNSGRNPLQIAQSKLKLLQRGGGGGTTDEAARIKAEVAQVVEMMQTFLARRGHDSEAELLNAFSSRLSLSDTPAQVETDVRDLLASLSGLSLGQGNQ